MLQRLLSPLPVSALTLLAAPAISQSRAVPAHAAVADGTSRFNASTDAYGFRWQILVDTATVAPNGAILNGLAFRSHQYEPQPSSVLNNVSIALSHTQVSVAGMSTAFANNAGGTGTTVFQGS